MRCLDCGAEMQLIEVPDKGMASTGYERHAFECPNCRNRPDRLLKPVANERIRLPPPAPLIGRRLRRASRRERPCKFFAGIADFVNSAAWPPFSCR